MQCASKAIGGNRPRGDPRRKQRRWVAAHVIHACSTIRQASVVRPLRGCESVGCGRMAPPLVILLVARRPIQSERAARRRDAQAIMKLRLLVVARREVARSQRALQGMIESREQSRVDLLSLAPRSGMGKHTTRKVPEAAAHLKTPLEEHATSTQQAMQSRRRTLDPETT